MVVNFLRLSGLYNKLGNFCILIKVYKECVFTCVTLDDGRGNCSRCSSMAHHICFLTNAKGESLR